MSALAFGCGPIGGRGLAARDDSVAALTAGWDCGIRHFDTAPSYGDGAGEELLALALRDWPRHEVTVSTKVGRVRMAIEDRYGRPEGPCREPLFDFTAPALRASVHTSLHRLGLDHLDMVGGHDPDDHLDLAVRETFPALRDMSEVGAVGVGTTSVDAARTLVRLGAVDVVLIAGAWSLTRRGAAALLDECAATGVTVLAAAPFDSGLLARDEGRYLYRPVPPDVHERVRAMARLCAGHGVRLRQTALQFPLRHPAVGPVVTGMCSPEEVRDNTALLGTPVPDALWAELDQLVT